VVGQRGEGRNQSDERDCAQQCDPFHPNLIGRSAKASAPSFEWTGATPRSFRL
jgi:hypothetical protein